MEMIVSLWGNPAPAGGDLHMFTAHGRDRSVASGRGAARGAAAPARRPAGAGVPDLSGEGGHQPPGSGGLAFGAGDGDLLVAAPEEDIKGISALPAFVFINRHGSAPCPGGDFNRG